MKLTRQQVLDLLVRAEAAGLLPADGPTSLSSPKSAELPFSLRSPRRIPKSSFG